ncbi:hypothetical protein, partial [Burkholderia pseudomallei]|uniref:hypothetical protein n=1 Tax=Burkholderia pseudomallei TaxID=28450 RepID=UPI001C4C98DF
GRRVLAHGRAEPQKTAPRLTGTPCPRRPLKPAKKSLWDQLDTDSVSAYPLIRAFYVTRA